MHNYKMLLAYDGTNYGGWQNQPNSVSIQSLLEKALLTLHKEKIIVTGSGRTDAGVHALGQVAHFTLPVEANLYKLKHSINGLIPQDIRVVSIEETFVDGVRVFIGINKAMMHTMIASPN